MKKIITLSALVSVSFSAFAYSTCETRVDSHQEATTRQRVAYCLNEEQPVVTPANNPELVYYGVTTNEPKEQTQPAPSKNKHPYFEEDKMDVTKGYVGTSRFPELKNDTITEQERLAARKAILEQEKQHYRFETKPAKVQPVQAQPETQTKQVSPDTPQTVADYLATSSTEKETNAGLSKRHKKPARQMKQTQPVMPLEDETAIPTQPDTVQQATSEPDSAQQPEITDLQSPYDMPYDNLEDVSYGAN